MIDSSCHSLKPYLSSNLRILILFVHVHSAESNLFQPVVVHAHKVEIFASNRVQDAKRYRVAEESRKDEF